MKRKENTLYIKKRLPHPLEKAFFLAWLCHQIYSATFRSSNQDITTITPKLILEKDGVTATFNITINIKDVE